MEKLEMPVADFKSRFSEALEVVARGGSVCVTYGRSHRPVAVLAPPPQLGKMRKLGLMSGKMKVCIKGEWEISESEFLGS